MIDEVMQELQENLEKSVAALRRELGKVRTGRASPAILDRIRIDYYGVPTPIAQMATVSVPDARLLVVKPWEKSQVSVIERAIREEDLGLNPRVDGDILRVPIPPLTEERRKEMVKLARRAGEDAKVAIRKHRRDAIDLLTSLRDEGEVPEDDADRAKKKLEDLVGDGVKKVDTVVAEKEKEVMEV
ncbi:MAG: ribosome recycling factor [Deltaproteobacteria bacterium]|nr:ribosome recycling factor [Deltaproteobacteria bacterium]